jgi:hypothetical protein
MMPVFVAPRTDLPALPPFILLTGGLVWQFVVAAFLIVREVKPLTWTNIRRRLWRTTPRYPRTGRPSKKLLLWAFPIAGALLVVDQFGLLAFLEEGFVDLFPGIAAPEYGTIQNLAQPEFVGKWWVLGAPQDEWRIRPLGLLRERGLFATYHLHLVWTIPSQILTDWTYAWAMKRYRSYCVSVIHSRRGRSVPDRRNDGPRWRLVRTDSTPGFTNTRSETNNSSQPRCRVLLKRARMIAVELPRVSLGPNTAQTRTYSRRGLALPFHAHAA